MPNSYVTEWVGQTLSNGRYRVDVRLSSHHDGATYRACDLNLDADVVLRTPSLDGSPSPDFVKRYSEDVRKLIRLSHPHLVKALDVGEHSGGIPFAVFQFLSGGSLEDQRTSSAGAFVGMPPHSLSWLTGIAAAVDFINQRGYLHGNVRPSNVLFDEFGHAYLNDFTATCPLLGKSSATLNSAASDLAFALGSPRYAAPELIQGLPFDGSVDQYALGVTVYELLAGRPPFDAPTKDALLKLHVAQNAPSLSKLDPQISPALAAAVARAMSKESRFRYPNCVAFANDVQAAVQAMAGAQKKQPAEAGPVLNSVVKLPCPKCAKTIRVSENYRGEKAACPNCGAKLVVSEDLQRLSLVQNASPRDYAVGANPRPLLTAAKPVQKKTDSYLDEILQSSPTTLGPVVPVYKPSSRKPLILAAGAVLVVAVLIGIVSLPSWASTPKPDVEAIPNQLLRKNDLFELQIKVKNPNDFAGSLRYRALGALPAGFSVDSATGRCSWLAKDVKEGDFRIAVEVSPVIDSGAATTIDFTIRVYREHNLPRVMIAGHAPTMPKEGEVVRVLLNGDDVDGDPITYEYRLQHSQWSHDWIVARSDTIEFPVTFSGDWVLQVRAKDESGTSPVVSHVILVAKKMSPETAVARQPLTADGRMAANSAAVQGQGAEFEDMPSRGAIGTAMLDVSYRNRSWEQYILQFQQSAFSSYYSRLELDSEREAIAAIVEMCRLHPKCMDALLDIVAGYRSGLAENAELRLRNVDKVFDWNAMPKPTTNSLPASGYENAVLAIYENRMPVSTRFVNRTSFYEIDRKDWLFMSLVELVGEPGIPSLVKATEVESMIIPMCSALGKIGSPAVPALNDLLNSKNPALAFHAIWGLALALRNVSGSGYVRFDETSELHQKAQDELQKLLYHEERNVHLAAALLLCNWAAGDAVHLPRLIKICAEEIASKTGEAQDRAAAILAGLPNAATDYIRSCETAIEKQNVPSAFAFSQLARFGQQGQSFHDQLIRTGRTPKSRPDDVPAIRIAAIRGVTFLSETVGPSREMIVSIGDAAQERDEKLRSHALQTLRDLGTEATPAIDVLRKLNKDVTIGSIHQRLISEVFDNMASRRKPKLGLSRISP